MNRDPAPAKRMLAGGGLLLLALIAWSLRNVAPAWVAKRVTVTADFTTTTERDDERVKRAFAAARRAGPFEIGWEPQPDSGRQIRHSRIWVQAPSESEAVAVATATAAAMEQRFKAEGAGQLMTDVHRRARPVPDDGTVLLGRALRAAALALTLLGLSLLVVGWCGVQAGPDRQPAEWWWAAAVFLAISIAPVLLPGALVMAIFILGVPGAISGTIIYKMRMVRKAAHWPSTRARITKSTLRTAHRTHADSSTTVVNIPVVEYEFTLGGSKYHGSHITGADNVGIGPPAQTLDRYPLDATVPVYYNPANPAEAVLERDLPWSPTVAYASAGAIFMAGVAATAALLNVDTLIVKLRSHFPPGAEPHLAIFFLLCGSWCLFILWDSRRQSTQAAGWPMATGCIVSSGVESYITSVGSTSSDRVRLFEAVVEYSYQVEGREYHSTQVAFGAKVAGSQESAEARAARYPAQSDVVVHYDPTNPSNAVLETKLAFGWLILAVAIVFLGLAIFFSTASHSDVPWRRHSCLLRPDSSGRSFLSRQTKVGMSAV